MRDWLAAADGGEAVMIAHRRVDVGELNKFAREEFRRRGELGTIELSLPGGDFAIGDRVVVKRNAPRLGVNNGDRGRVIAIDPASHVLAIILGDRRARLDASF